MASKEELKKLGVRVIEDDDFRSAYQDDPVAAAKSMGITLTGEQAKALEEHKKLAQAAGPRESKSGINVVGIFT